MHARVFSAASKPTLDINYEGALLRLLDDLYAVDITSRLSDLRISGRPTAGSFIPTSSGRCLIFWIEGGAARNHRGAARGGSGAARKRRAGKQVKLPRCLAIFDRRMVGRRKRHMLHMIKTRV